MSQEPEYKELPKKPDNSIQQRNDRPRSQHKLATRTSLVAATDIGFRSGNPASLLTKTGVFFKDGGLSPKVRIEPLYPSAAAMHGKE